MLFGIRGAVIVTREQTPERTLPCVWRAGIPACVYFSFNSELASRMLANRTDACAPAIFRRSSRPEALPVFG
jgi:hypothetical protein